MHSGIWQWHCHCLIDYALVLAIILTSRVVLEYNHSLFSNHNTKSLWPPPCDTGDAFSTPCEYDFSSKRPSTETVGGWMNTLVTYALPFALVLIYVFFAVPTVNALHELHHAALSLVGGRELCTLAVTLLKRYVSWKRPYWYEQLTANTDVDHAGESFPSAHAATAFAGMTFLAMYFLSKTRIMTKPVVWLVHSADADINNNNNDDAGRQRHHVRAKLYHLRLATFLFTGGLPYAYAFFVAASRIVDKVHHPADVIAGALIGLFTARSFFKLYFTSKGLPR